MTCSSTATDGQYPSKDPDEILDFSTSWILELPEDDTILTSVWIVPDGITKTSEGLVGKVATIWLSGGVLGETYEVLNRVTTTQGRIEDRTKYVYIEKQ